MLIYNHNKEFLGIDAGDLKALSLSSLAELQSESADFADLFVKSLGYIHNFKHIHWIDYILCSEDNEDQKVLIQIKNRTYSASITIKNLYLTNEPSKDAYIINLNNLKELSSSENQAIVKETKIVFDPYDVHPDVIAPTVVQKMAEDKKPLSIEDAKLYPTIQSADDAKADATSYETPVPKETQKNMEVEAIKIDHDIDKEEEYPFSRYLYNPTLASEDLGLPVDLIEEFVQDFIAQSNSFKESLYDNLKDGDLSKLKISAHKLKGVAANLKIENALDALTKINISQDAEVIGTYLDRFYKAIDKLSNGEISAIKHEVQEVKEEAKNQENEDLLILTFKDDNPKTIKRESKPADITELEDDKFLKQPFKLDETPTYDKEISTEDKKNSDEDEFFLEEFVDSKEIYNKKESAQKIGLDIESFNILFDDYLIQSRELANLITKYAKEGNLAECKDTAMKLKEISKKMVVDSFEQDLEIIINASDTSVLNIISENITSTLDKLSNIRG